MERRLRTAIPVQCLYCETELKPFRGFFDEDFCCREHRDKYFSSFRKAVSRLPVLDIPPEAPKAESAWLSTLETEEPVFSVDSPSIPEETVESSHPEVLATAHEHEEVTPPAAAPPAEFPAETVEEPLPVAAFAAEGSAITAVYEETPEPPEADFLHFAVSALAGAPSARSASHHALPASDAVEVPDPEVNFPAVLEIEQRPADFAEPPEMTEATVFAAAPVPFQLSVQDLSIVPAAAMLPEAALPEAEEPVACAQPQEAPGYGSPWNYADPLTPAALALTVASFCPAEDGAAGLPAAEFAELTPRFLPLVSSPIATADIGLVHEFYAPELAPSHGPLLGEEEREEPGDQMPALDSPAPPEIAPALVMNSEPVDRPALMPAFAAAMMPPALELSPSHSSAAAPLSAPGLASTIEGQPSLAPELMADIPQAPAANQAAEPHTHAPLRPWFGSSVRIKNWRLRITFAKPA